MGGGKGYDTLILDLNGNGDLNDDPIFKKLKSEPKEQPYVFFGPIEMAAAWHPTYYAQAYVFDQRLGAASGQDYRGMLMLRSGCYMEANIEVGSVQQKIGLLDGNCNLSLGDKAVAVTPASANRTTVSQPFFWGV